MCKTVWRVCKNIFKLCEKLNIFNFRVLPEGPGTTVEVEKPMKNEWEFNDLEKDDIMDGKQGKTEESTNDDEKARKNKTATRDQR